MRRCLVSDFGCAKQIPEEQPTSAGAPAHSFPDSPPPIGASQCPPHLVIDTVGAPAFRAPEALSGFAYDPFAADAWAAGITLYCFLYGQVPFYADRDCVDIIDLISSASIDLVWPPKPHSAPASAVAAGCDDCDPDAAPILNDTMNSPISTAPPPIFGEEPSSDAKDLILRLLAKSPADRLTMADALLHPWLASFVEE